MVHLVTPSRNVRSEYPKYPSAPSVLYESSKTRPGSPRLAPASEFWAPCNSPSSLFASSTRLKIIRWATDYSPRLISPWYFPIVAPSAAPYPLALLDIFTLPVSGLLPPAMPSFHLSWTIFTCHGSFSTVTDFSHHLFIVCCLVITSHQHFLLFWALWHPLLDVGTIIHYRSCHGSLLIVTDRFYYFTGINHHIRCKLSPSALYRFRHTKTEPKWRCSYTL